MIKVYPLILIFFSLISGCTNLSPKFQKRTPAQVGNNTSVFSPSYIGSDVGTVRISMLDEGTFRKINGPGWVLADGRCVSETCKADKNSDYFNLTSEIRIPNMRGKFLRMLNNGIKNKDCPRKEESCFDIEKGRKIGSYQKDEFTKHFHYVSASSGVYSGDGKDRKNFQGYMTRHVGDEPTKAAGNSPETRPENIAVNFFIKINED